MGIPVFFASHIPFQGSRSKIEFIGFAGRRARTEPESGLLFRLFPFQGSRSETEFIGFAGRRARTNPDHGLLFHLFPFQGSRSETEFIGFAESKAPTGSPRARNREKKKSCRSSSFPLVDFGHFIPPKMQFSIGSL